MVPHQSNPLRPHPISAVHSSRCSVQFAGCCNVAGTLLHPALASACGAIRIVEWAYWLRDLGYDVKACPLPQLHITTQHPKMPATVNRNPSHSMQQHHISCCWACNTALHCMPACIPLPHHTIHGLQIDFVAQFSFQSAPIQAVHEGVWSYLH